jgi:hypothetical protein
MNLRKGDRKVGDEAKSKRCNGADSCSCGDKVTINVCRTHGQSDMFK